MKKVQDKKKIKTKTAAEILQKQLALIYSEIENYF